MGKPRVYQQSSRRVVLAIAVALAIPVLGAILWPADRTRGFLVGFAAYFVIAKILRAIVLGHGRRGLRAFDNDNYDEALRHFHESERFFRQYPWIDNWRTVLAQSTSEMSMTELALVNTASCHLSAGRTHEARQQIELVLSEFPDNTLAQQMVRTWDQMRSESQDEAQTSQP